MKASSGMTVSELIELSGITKQTTYSAHDYAIPMYQDHRYGLFPYGGNAIAVYWKGCYWPEVIPYYELAKMALDRPIKLNNGQLADLEMYAKQEDEVEV